MRLSAPLLSLLLCSGAVHAQRIEPARRPTVSGMVFDSIALAPLRGAVVQAVQVGPGVTGASPTYTAISDAAGRFRFDTLPAGRFALGFQHDALNVFGLESPVAGLEWTAGADVTADLILPSSPAIRAQLCDAGANTSDQGVLGGSVRDGYNNALGGTTTVAARWFELGLDKGKLISRPHEVTKDVSADGTYLLCGIPVDAPVEVAVTSPGARAVKTEITVQPNRIVVRRDFVLSSSTASHGTAAVAGKVATADGTPVVAGLVALPALDREVPIENGAFSLSSLPAGTWTLDVRALGYEPLSVAVTATDSASTTLSVEMVKAAQTLEVVNVVGKVGRDVKILDGIQQRMLSSHGTYFGPGNEYLAYALFPADVARAAAGFSYAGFDKISARGCIKSSLNGGKGVAIYLDGVRQPGGLNSVSNMIPMKDVLAVEAYADVVSAPALWRTNDACAVVAIWSKPLY